MLKAKELLGLTGYVHGGCSPIGMKKQFKTVIHSTAAAYETIMFSAGKIGYQVELSLTDLQKVIPVQEADIISRSLSGVCRRKRTVFYLLRKGIVLLFIGYKYSLFSNSETETVLLF